MYYMLLMCIWYTAVEKSVKITKIIKNVVFNIINLVYVICYQSKYYH